MYGLPTLKPLFASSKQEQKGTPTATKPTGMSEQKLPPKPRQSVNILHLGDQRTGKTVYNRHVCQTQFRAGRGVIVLDINRQSEYADLPRISIEGVKGFLNLPKQKQFVKVWLDPARADADFKEFCTNVNLYVRNSLVVFEDFMGILDAVPPKVFKGMINNNRNINNDYIFCVHNVEEVPRIVFKRANVFWIRQTEDDPKKLHEKVPFSMRTKLSDALIKVRNENARRYYNPNDPTAPKLAFVELLKGEE